MLYYTRLVCEEITKNGIENIKKLKYKLHAKVRKEGHKVKLKDRTVYVAYDRRNDLSNNVLALRDIFSYAIQIEIQ